MRNHASPGRLHLLAVSMVLTAAAGGAAHATQPMRPGSLQGCVAGEFILTGKATAPEEIFEVSEFEGPAALDVEWAQLEGKTIALDYAAGDVGTRPTARFTMRLTGKPRALGPCEAAMTARIPHVLAMKADERARDIDPFKSEKEPLTPREAAAGNYALRLIDEALGKLPGSCAFAVSKAFILDRARRTDEALAQLDETRTWMKCNPLHERVQKRYFSTSRLPVEEASDAEERAWEALR